MSPRGPEDFAALARATAIDLSPAATLSVGCFGKVRNLHKAHSFTGEPPSAYLSCSFRPADSRGPDEVHPMKWEPDGKEASDDESMQHDGKV